MFGAYVLFPYHNEEEYRNHRFYQSIEKVNIGGLPFLPSATKMVTELLDDLISDSPESAFERTTLPRGIEEKLAKVDWSSRDVLVGTLRNRTQLQVCLDGGFYYTPAVRISEDHFPVHYVAIYQSIRLFGNDAGIRCYGEVTKCIPVSRSEILEFPSAGTEPYYRFEVREWKELSRPIAPKEIGRVLFFTNLFLLEHSSEVPELFIRSEEEYRLYSELKRSINDTAINDEDNALGFVFNDFSVHFEDGHICVSKNGHIFAQYEISAFSRSPNATFHLMLQDLERYDTQEEAL